MSTLNGDDGEGEEGESWEEVDGRGGRMRESNC